MASSAVDVRCPAPDGSGGGARRGVRATVAGVACVVAVVSVLVVAAAAAAGDRTRPDDPMFDDQWALENTGQMVNWTEGTPGADIDATRAWNLTTGSRSVVVAILDSDFDYRAEDLATNAWTNPGGVNGCAAGTHGYHVPTRACEPYAVASHGTRMGWIIGAVGDNGQGMSGVDWTTSLMGVTFRDERTDATVIEAIDWIVDARQAGVDVRVINASFAWTSGSDQVREAIARAGQAGILFVTGAGNDGEDNDTRDKYPCNFDLSNVICVAASDQHDELAPGSAYGDRTVDLAAPGRNICDSPHREDCGGQTSTSEATAFVSGAAALVWSYNPGLSVGQVRSALLGNVDRLDSLDGKVATGGRLNVYRAITSTDSTSPSPSDSDSGSPSPSPSESDSESTSTSPSPSPSESESPSPSESDSTSPSPSESTSWSDPSGDDLTTDGSSSGDDDDGDDRTSSDAPASDGQAGSFTIEAGTDRDTSNHPATGTGDDRPADQTHPGSTGDGHTVTGNTTAPPPGQAPTVSPPPSTGDTGATDPAAGDVDGTDPSDITAAAGTPHPPQQDRPATGWWWAAAVAALGLAGWRLTRRR